MDEYALLRTLAKKTSGLPGDVVEVGVYRGATARVLCDSLPEKRVHLFDTFEGMPAPCELDGHKEGDYRNTSVARVEENLSEWSNYEIHPGFFPDTADLLPEIVCFAHIDCDLYESYKACIKWIYPRLPAGGIMLFDDYGYPKCLGAKQAVEESFSDFQASGGRAWVTKE